MKTRTETVIDASEWDAVVVSTYGKPYKFQQQCGCRDRGSFRFRVPDAAFDFDMSESIPEEINGNERGVKFAAWIARDPKTPLNGDEIVTERWGIDLWWARNFYPDFQTLANDMLERGVLKAGNYTINIDW